MRALFKAYPFQSFHGLLLINHGMVILRNHNIFHSCQVRDKIEFLEDQADHIFTDIGKLGLVKVFKAAPAQGN